MIGNCNTCDKFEPIRVHYFRYFTLKIYEIESSGQSYKASTIVNYDSRAKNINNCLLITSL